MIPSGHTGSHPTTRAQAPPYNQHAYSQAGSSSSNYHVQSSQQLPSIIFRRGILRRAPVKNYIPNPVISINYSRTRAPQHHSPHYEDRAPPMQTQSDAYPPDSDAMPTIHYDGSFPDSVRSSPENPPAAWPPADEQESNQHPPARPPAVDPVSNLLESTSSQLEQWNGERHERPRQDALVEPQPQATNYEQNEGVRDDTSGSSRYPDHYNGSYPDSLPDSPPVSPPAAPPAAEQVSNQHPQAWPPGVNPVSNRFNEIWPGEELDIFPRQKALVQSRPQATNHEQDEDGSRHYRPSTRRQAHRGLHIYEQYNEDSKEEEEEKAPASSPILAAKILSRVASNSSIVTDMTIEPQISVPTCISILSRSPNLCKLEITLWPITSKEENALQRFEPLRHNLSTLVLITSIHPKPLFDWLILPRLARLSIDARTGHYQRNNDHQAIYDLLTQSACALKSLKLVDVYPSTEDLNQSLRSPACLTLQKLVVRSTLLPSIITWYTRENLSAETLKELTGPTEGSNVDGIWIPNANGALMCPELKSAEFSYCAGDAQVFVDMVKSRVERGPFKVKFVHWDRDVSREIVRQLEVLARTAPHPLQFEESQVHVINGVGRRDTICNYYWDSGVDMGWDT